MSRIGNKPITVPEGVEVKIDGKHITVKGPKGTLEREIHKNISLTMEGNEIKVTRINDEAQNRSLHGLTRTLINNMITGVKDEYSKDWSELSETAKERYYTKYAKENDLINEDAKTYDEWNNDYELETFVGKYTTKSGDRVVAFGKYGYDG